MNRIEEIRKKRSDGFRLNNDDVDALLTELAQREQCIADLLQTMDTVAAQDCGEPTCTHKACAMAAMIAAARRNYDEAARQPLTPRGE